MSINIENKRAYNRRYYQNHLEEFREKAKRWKERNPEGVKAISRRYLENHRDEILAKLRQCRLTVNGRQVRVIKRPRPDGICELCGKSWQGRLVYHHWNGTVVEGMKVIGVWVCSPCHTVCEGVEKGLAEKYIVLREKIMEEEDNGAN